MLLNAFGSGLVIVSVVMDIRGSSHSDCGEGDGWYGIVKGSLEFFQDSEHLHSLAFHIK